MSLELNQHLGKQLRSRRSALGLTQTQVARAINVTFQQIQKYEKGTNGVSSSRLLQLANFLKVPIKYFFEDFKDFQNQDNQSTKGNGSTSLETYVANLSEIEKEKLSNILSLSKKISKTA
jgi:transcriptional regulator with XRE-family HTH domain